jgi:hypothetical protein
MYALRALHSYFIVRLSFLAVEIQATTVAVFVRC